MPNKKLVRHGTNNGYRAENTLGDACERCKAAHRVFQTQYNKVNRAAGLKYGGDEILDHLDGKVQSKASTVQSLSGYTVGSASRRPTAPEATAPVPDDTGPYGASPGRERPSLADRVKAMVIGGDDDQPDGFVNEPGIPDYITVGTIDPDPDPEGDEYRQVPQDNAEYIINAAGMAKIEDSLGTYLSIFGITMEMIDPYCGPVLAENMDNIVKHWAKVISKYPKAAELFMDGKGGTLMTWISAIQATWPFLFAMYEHHFSKDVQTSGGQIFRKTGQNSGGRFDPTMPPMEDKFNYSAG